MKKIILVIIGAILLITLGTFCGFQNTTPQSMLNFKNGTYDKEWRTIDSLEREGLTKSALEKTEVLFERAKKENNPSQIVKTLLYRGKYQARLEEDGLVKAIYRFQQEAESADFPVKPVLQSMLAEMYSRYLQQNYYKFSNRTTTINFKGEDIRTWTPEQLNKKSIELYNLSIQNTETRRVPLKELKDITNSYNTELFFPTLHDFLIKRALDYFSNERTYLTEPAYKFYIDQDQAFAPARQFMDFKFTTKDSFSLKYFTLLRYQEWIASHINDDNPSTLLYADLGRLSFAYNNSVAPNKKELYKKALETLKGKYSNHETFAEIVFKIGRIHQENGNTYKPSPTDENKWELKTAVEIYQLGIDKYPKSYGGIQCYNATLNIKQQSLGITTEKVNAVNEPFLAKVSYKEFNNLHFKTIKLSEEQYETIRTKRRRDLLPYLNKLDIVKKWSTSVPNDGDFQTHSTEVKIDGLPVGHYMVMVADNSSFSGGNNNVSYYYTYVSNISFLVHNDHRGRLEYSLMDRVSGEPLEGVKIEFFERKYSNSSRKYNYILKGTESSDGQGKVVNPGFDSRNFRVKFTYKDDYLYLDDYYYARNHGDYNNSRKSTTFFTDRAIYRPGQTIYFKGIVLNQDNDQMPSIVSDFKTSVIFYDANYQKVTSLDVKTNEYGTFSGSFTAPSSGLLGQMTISDESTNSSKGFRVEEYKRPKFEVDFDPVKVSYRLNDKVKVSGFAKAYAGSNIDNAKVSYRVVRQVRFPYWRWWYWGWYNPFQKADMEITNGFTTTDENGKFEIEFEALPDRSIPKDRKPEFIYKVMADVVDITGETHAGSASVKVGYIALNADINVPEKINRDSLKEFKLTTKNLNGEFEAAEGTVTIKKLTAPANLYKNRYWDIPDKPTIKEAEFKKDFPSFAYSEEANVSKWAKGKTVLTEGFDTKSKKEIAVNKVSWETGRYEVTLTTKDKYGEPIEVVKYFHLYDLDEKAVSGSELFWHSISKTSAEPGETVDIYFGSAYKDAWFLYTLLDGESIVSKEWVKAKGIEKRSVKIEEKHRGNIFYKIAMVHDNRAYVNDYQINVPWSNKELTLEYSTFRDKLLPGADEEWQVKLIGPKGDKVAAEMLASMYDASLDAFTPHSWNAPGYPNNYDRLRITGQNNFSTLNASTLSNKSVQGKSRPPRYYPSLNWFNFTFYEGRYYDQGYMMEKSGRGPVRTQAMPKSAPMMTEGAPPPGAPDMQMAEMAMMDTDDADGAIANAEPVSTAKPVSIGGNEDSGSKDKNDADFSDVKVRTNLNETVFFFPDLMTDADGNVIIKFKMNEALTRWKFMTFAHTKDYKYGFSEKEIVTQKDLMVMPNPPRFLREFDEIHFTAKVSNLSEKDLTGQAKIELFDAISMEPIDAKLGCTNTTLDFSAKQGQSAPLSWKLTIPADLQAVTYRVVAKAGSFSDGEESSLPVLTNRMLVTETMPLPVRGKQSKNFDFTAMQKASQSNTLTNHKFTLEFTSNPAWYAIQALPYMMEYPYKCTEQIFSRYYANSLASSVANSHPKVKRVFEQWKNTDAMLSNLSKNEELKYVLLEETPWVLNAQSEEQQKKRIGLLFDLNKMANEKEKALREIEQRQLSNGGFAWFPGGRENWYITQYIVEGMGHLDRLGVKSLKDDPKARQVAEKAVAYIDYEIAEQYKELLRLAKEGRIKMEDNHLGYMAIHYLYARTFFLDIPVKGKTEEAFSYYLGQADKYWLENGMYLQGMLALALHRKGNKVTPDKIVRALKENSLNSEEMGMYWKYTRGYYWHQLPIETHALMIEVFDEVANDEKAVDDLKVWLLKNKQTNHWKTTKATASAVYAMLLRGENWLLEDEPVQIKLGNKTIDQSKMKTEAGTGYFKTSWDGKDIDASMAKVEVKNPNSVVAWGAAYWQYFEDLDKIKTFEDTPLKLIKKVFREENTPTGPAIKPVYEQTKLAPGDKLKIRIELRVDRDMEYVHMKDMRASGFEPMNVMSQYKWQGGLGYYESTKDASTNFFISFLPKGTYVFEYPLRVNHRGNFSNGITTIQCMYAPEFTSHSEGIRINVE